MKPFKNILVAVDFGASSAGAIQLAVDLAKTFEAELTLVHVWEVPLYPYSELMLSTHELIETVRQAAQARLDTTLKSVQTAAPRAKSLLKMGVAWQQILETIEETSPDLLVMGTHGRHGLSHAILGSVAEKVVRLSPIPVLTTHPSNGAATG